MRWREAGAEAWPRARGVGSVCPAGRGPPQLSSGFAVLSGLPAECLTEPESSVYMCFADLSVIVALFSLVTSSYLISKVIFSKQ